MRIFALLVVCLLLGACAAGPPVRPASLFKDHLFDPPSEPIRADGVFALSPAMERYLETTILPTVQARGYTGLIEALYDRKQLKLEYESAMTRNAAQAFEARSGNCLSLVVMTAAFARRLGLSIRYQSVLNEESWSRAGSLYVTSGHVNLALGPPGALWNTRFEGLSTTTIDFLPASKVGRQRIRVIGERTVVAMYFNNRAAEALARDRVDDAYWFARAAIDQDPTFVAAFVTLGVAYHRHRNLPEAELAFSHVLAREPANTAALSNLALVLRAGGRGAEAQRLADELARLEPHPPFHFFDLGVAAMRRGDFAAAREWFAKEIDRAAYYHEFHFWLAAAHFELGDFARSRQHLRLALENSTTREDRDLYAAKLERIKSWRER